MSTLSAGLLQSSLLSRRKGCYFNCPLPLHPNQLYLMLRCLRTQFFCANQWKQLVSPHILRIVEHDHKYQPCRRAMQAVAEGGGGQAKTKCNMLFSIFTCSDSLAHLRPALASLITSRRVTSQSQLDQLLKWLSKEIKLHSEIGQQELIVKVSNHEQELAAFQEALGALGAEGEELQVNSVCKALREKYTTIDSQLIYQEVRRIAQQRGLVPPHKKEDNKFWDKIADIKPRQLKIQCNSKEQTAAHKQVTQGRLRFRFPPEPNGYLHIGHLKAMRINFESALRTGGTCYLRYDDTNPDKQSHEFIQEIQKNIQWLGYTPDKISFASDYFEQLEGLAHQLIKDGNAYVCESSQEEIEHQRKHKLTNPFRERTIQENLKIFPHLTGPQTLRLKAQPAAVNPTLRDPVIYRQKSHPHPRTGTKFKIYPTYDFAHCTCDSLEHIDYSLCSLEFQIRRELYYTFLDLLKMWKPVVWEYSRLNIEGNVLSKRKIKAMIDSGLVEGWDDARLLTIRGLINRGYTPAMLISFIDKVNASRTGNQNYIQWSLLEQQMKKVLLLQAPKAMAVLDPVQTTITNPELVPSLTSHTIFIEAKDHFALQEGETLVLKTLGAFRVEERSSSSLKLSYLGGNIAELKKQSQSRLKILHWIGMEGSVVYPTVMFDKLLTPQQQFNPKSKEVYSGARVPEGLLKERPQYVQFERIGFFRFADGAEQLQLCTKL